MHTEHIVSNVKQCKCGVLLEFTIEGNPHQLDIDSAVNHRDGNIDWRIIRQLLIAAGFNTEMASHISVVIERQQDIRDSTAKAEYYHPFAKFIGECRRRAR